MPSTGGAGGDGGGGQPVIDRVTFESMRQIWWIVTEAAKVAFFAGVTWACGRDVVNAVKAVAKMEDKAPAADQAVVSDTVKKKGGKTFLHGLSTGLRKKKQITDEEEQRADRFTDNHPHSD